MCKRTGGSITSIKKKVWLPLAMITFGVSVLFACGKQSDEVNQDKSFGIDLLQELTVQSPEQVVCGQDGAWAITAQKSAPIYYIAYETQTVGVEMIKWQQEEGESSQHSRAGWNSLCGDPERGQEQYRHTKICRWRPVEQRYGRSGSG